MDLKRKIHPAPVLWVMLNVATSRVEQRRLFHFFVFSSFLFLLIPLSPHSPSSRDVVVVLDITTLLFEARPCTFSSCKKLWRYARRQHISCVSLFDIVLPFQKHFRAQRTSQFLLITSSYTSANWFLDVKKITQRLQSSDTHLASTCWVLCNNWQFHHVERDNLSMVLP